MNRVRWWILALGLGLALAGSIGWLVVRTVMPEIIARELRATLADRGFPHARFEVASAGLSHVRLSDVVLDDGLALGEVAIDGGLAMWWTQVADRIEVRGARLDGAALARAARARGGAGAGAGAILSNGASLPVDRIVVRDAEVAIDAARIAVAGQISLRDRSLELTGSLDELAIGGLVMRDLAARVRGGAGELRACVTGRASHATGEACSSLPASAAELAALTAADVTWSVREADARVPWTGQGRGRLVWSSGPRLHDGRIEIAVPVRTIGIATVEEARLVADVEGDPDRLELRGEARAARAAIRDEHATIHVRDVVLPFEVHGRYAGGALQLAADHPVVVRAEDVRMAGEPLRVTRPEVVLREGGEPPFVVGGRNAWPDRLRWRAAEVRGGTSQLRTLTGTIATRGGKLGVARWSAATAQWRTARALRATGTFDLSRGRRGVVTWRAPAAEWRRAQISEPSGRLDLGTMRGRVAWAAVRGPYALEIGRGEVTYRSGREQVRIESGRADALGGSLLVEPFDARLDAVSNLVVHARRLQLAQVARAVGRGRLEGSGLVDGSFAVQFDQVDVAVTAGAFEARPRARLRVRDAAWRQRAAAAARASANKAALHTRIVGALAELDCTRLAAVLGPSGADPDVTLSIRGRGVRVPQELDLSIRVRGVRAAARTLHRY